MATPTDSGQSQAAPPVCYRHPGRQTYVSCVRCGRPACPDCLRPAAVGHQCVDCIRQGNQGVRTATGRFGGRNNLTGARVTLAIMGLNILLYVVQYVHQSLPYDWEMLGAWSTLNGPHITVPGGQLIGVAGGQWYRLITSAFLPGTGYTGLLDIAFNMYALYFVGPAIERVLGPARFLGVYLLSALGGSLCYYFLAQYDAPALGASGAIFGLFGAWFILARRLGSDWRPVVFLIVLNLAISFVGASIIAWQAHVGGLATGLVLTAAYAYAPRKNRTLIQIAATVLVLALLCAGVALRDYQLIHQVIL
jgi:membrane associated rhomboid family serine protease